MKHKTEKPQPSWTVGIISGLVVLFLMAQIHTCATSPSKPKPTTKPDGNYTEETAYNMCRVLVLSSANYPAEADVDIDEVFYKGKTTIVQGKAKLMNGFGAKITKEFECSFTQGKAPGFVIRTARGF